MKTFSTNDLQDDQLQKIHGGGDHGGEPGQPTSKDNFSDSGTVNGVGSHYCSNAFTDPAICLDCVHFNTNQCMDGWHIH